MYIKINKSYYLYDDKIIIMNLRNKVIVITGGSKGFGKKLAEAFLKEGANVVISSNNEKEIQNVAKEIGAFGIFADVTREEDLTYLLKATIKKFNGVDIWINNAGLWLPHDFAENFDMNLVRKIFEVNVIGLMNGSRVALRFMKEKGTGTIINIISDSGLIERPMSSSYCASKWAAAGFTKSIRGENEKISILGVYPGGMKTEIFGPSKPEGFDNFMETSYVVEKVINNLKSDDTKVDLIVQKPI